MSHTPKPPLVQIYLPWMTSHSTAANAIYPQGGWRSVVAIAKAEGRE